MSDHPLLPTLRLLAARPPEDLPAALIDLEFRTAQKIALRGGVIVAHLHGVEHRLPVAVAPVADGGPVSTTPKRGPGRPKKDTAA
jgi:hypothetical protein